MASFWGEIRRRKVFQVAVAYAIVGWLLAQVAATTFPVLLLPDWILRAFVIILLLGFPIAVVLAWAFETTPDGVIRDRGPSATDEPKAASGTVMLYGGGALVVGLILGGLTGKTVSTDTIIESTKTPLQLTGNPDDNPVIGSAISPDGQYLAYADSGALYLRVIESGEAHKIVDADDEGLTFSSLRIDWFPSGTHLVFTAQADGKSGLYKVPIVGGSIRKLADAAVIVAVAPDGRSIAYTPALFQGTVLTMGPDGENPVELVSLERASVPHIAWSPDSRFLLIGAMQQTTNQREQVLYAFNTETSELVRTYSNERTFQNWRGYLPFLWLPDGRLIFAQRELPPSEQMSNLWKARLDEDSAELVEEPTRLTSITGYNFQDLSSTADGSRLTFVLEENTPDVYVANLENNGRRLSNVRQFTFDNRYDLPGGWTPDSTEIYFRSERGVHENIYAKAFAEGEPRVVTGTLFNTSDAVQHSPDGQWLLYWDKPGIYRTPIGGGPSEHVLDGTRYSEFDCPPTVTADSTCVVSMLESDGKFAFYAFNPDYGLGSQLFQIDIPPTFANWSMSPDRTRIALAHNLGILRIVDIETLEEKELTNSTVRFGEFLDWTADGQGLILDAWVGSGSRMKSLIYVSTETEEVVILREAPNQWHLTPVVSPDGGKIAFGVMKFSGNAWMIENP